MVVLSLSVPGSNGKQETGGKCIRYLDSIFIVNRVRNFHHIDHMARLVTKLREEEVITEMTYTIVMQRLTQSIHGNCELKTRLRKRKRQALIGGALLFAGGWFAGGAMTSPLLEEFLHPSWATEKDLWKVNSYLADLAQHVEDLDQRLRFMERQSEILELLLGITTALEVEMEKFTELTTSVGFSTIQYKLLEPVRRIYERRKILNESRIVDLAKDRIPHDTWRLSAKMVENKNCTKANLQISVFAAVPSDDCLRIVETKTDYIVLKNDAKCLVLQPLPTLTLLPDNTYFAQSNYFISNDCNITRLNINFELRNGVFLAKPTKNSSAIGDCGQVLKASITNTQGVAAKIDCSAFLSAGDSAPKVSDLFAPRIKVWTINNTVINKVDDESFLYIVDDMKIPEMPPTVNVDSPPLTTDGETDVFDLKWLGCLSLPLLIIGAVVGWKLRRTASTRTAPISRPEISVQYMEKDLRKSEELINDLRNILEMKHTYISTSSFDTTSDFSSVSTKARARWSTGTLNRTALSSGRRISM